MLRPRKKPRRTCCSAAMTAFAARPNATGRACGSPYEILWTGSRRWKMRMTPDEIQRQGLEALRERLGRAGMIRFMQQFESGSGDYARERHAWVDRTSLEDIRKLAGLRSTKRKRGA